MLANINLRVFGGSALTADIPGPTDFGSQNRTKDIPGTYAPARHTIFTFVLALAATIEATNIFIGVNALDYSGYPECRPEFINSFESMANLASKAAVEHTAHTAINTPLNNLAKVQIIELGIKLNVDHDITHSCYDLKDDGTMCGVCDSCVLRDRGFPALGMLDPAVLR